ncbi:MAG: hypothetical protein C5B60_10030 [Chloroflexi bacterium]|nr:MAG: hypothetical protein C5B60_10030 [Chloroflexota bacterium]
MMPDFACTQCRAQLAEYVAGTLPEPASRLVARHLQTCSRCAGELDAWQKIGAAVRGIANPPVESSFSQSWDSLHAALASPTQRARSGKGYSNMDHDLRTTTIPFTPIPPQGPERPFTSGGRGKVRALVAVAAVLALIIGSAAIFGVLAQQRSPTVRGTGTMTPVPASSATAPAGASVKVYFSKHPDSDANPLAVFAVTRTTTRSSYLPEFAVQEELKGPTPGERAQGYYSPFASALTGVSICSASSQDFELIPDHRGQTFEAGTVTLRFCRQVNIAGDLDGPRMTAALQKTLLQFSQFKAVVVLNSAGNCFDDLRGGNTCLQSSQTSYAVHVYFSKHPDSDNDPALVFGVQRMSPTLGVATYAVAQLVAGPTQTEQSQGYYTPLGTSLQGASSCGGPDFIITLDHRGTTPQTGTATLQFCRQTLLAGDLTGARITAEITTTLEQFSNIHQVVILTETGTCFNDFTGQNSCLH